MVIDPKARESATERVGAVPVPERVTAVGLPEALCVRERVAVFAPEVEGAKETVRFWVCPASTVKAVGVTEKSAASVPERVTSETVSVAVPVLETARVWETEVPMAAVPRSREAATEILGLAGFPFPFRDTVVGLPMALCVMERVSVFAPGEVGEKVTVIS